MKSPPPPAHQTAEQQQKNLDLRPLMARPTISVQITPGFNDEVENSKGGEFSKRVFEYIKEFPKLIRVGGMTAWGDEPLIENYPFSDNISVLIHYGGRKNVHAQRQFDKDRNLTDHWVFTTDREG